MTQTVASEPFTLSRQAVDPRADGARRLVHVSNTSVLIERVVDGVRMRVGVPVAAYRELVLAVRLASGQATLRLAHDDAELEVVLASGEGVEVARRGRALAEMMGKPIRLEEAGVMVRAAIARRRAPAQPGRRSKFARRRKAGIAARLETSFSGEREIIARD